jgi:ribosome-associated protein
MVKRQQESGEKLIENVIEGLFEKGAVHVVKMDMRNLENRVCDYFIIAHGTSDQQVEALGYSIIDVVRREIGIKPFHLEGMENKFWVLIDYGTVMVHLFQEEYRSFYNLEGLWADSVTEVVEDPMAKK